MSTPVATWKQAKYLTALLVYPSTISGSTVTWGTAVDLAAAAGTATFDMYSLNISYNQVSIRPADSVIESMVNEFQTFDLSIHEISPANGYGNLKAIFASSIYVKMVAKFSLPSGTVYCDAAMGIIESVTTGIQQGKNTDTMSVKPGFQVAPFSGAFSAIPAAYS